MKPKSLIKQVQAIELEILIEVDRICREYNIPYFLDSGTALGAVRHGGFIPWDDDIDIGMLRPDYERFVSIAQSQLGSEYFLQTYHTDGAPIMFAKVHRLDTEFVEYRLRKLPIHKGIFIDIFPYDFLPEGDQTWKHIKACADLYKKFQFRLIPDRTLRPDGSLSWYPKALMRRMTHWAHRYISPQKIVEQMEQEFTKYPESHLVTCHSWGGTYLFDLSDIFPLSEIEFEGHSFSAAGNIHNFLTELYGDYMTLPPESERVGHRPYRLSVGLQGEDEMPY